MRRSSHIALTVPAVEVENAVAYYRSLFGVQEKSRSSDGIELAGENFTIWIDSEDGKPPVLQEWITADGEAARAAAVAAGGVVTGDSDSGFYVTDPYGMAYHVYIESPA